MLLNQTRMDNSFVPTTATTLTSGTTLFKYIVKEKSKSVIVISSDEEGSDDDQTKATYSNSIEELAPKPRKRKAIKRKRDSLKAGNVNDPISLSDSEEEKENNEIIASPTQEEIDMFADTNNCYDDDEIIFNPINSISEQYTTTTEEQQQSSSSSSSSSSSKNENNLNLNFENAHQNEKKLLLSELNTVEEQQLYNKQLEDDKMKELEGKTINIELAAADNKEQQVEEQQQQQQVEDDDMSSLSDMMDLDTLSDIANTDLDLSIPNNNNNKVLSSPLSSVMSDISLKKEERSDSMDIDDLLYDQEQMKAPSTVDTIIPPNMDCTFLLRTIELYIQSVTDIPTIPNTNTTSDTQQTRTSRRTTRLQDNSSAMISYYSKSSTPEINTAPYEPINPYVPSRAWYNSTWEDWAQLDVGDILHCPFKEDEIQVIDHCVQKQSLKKSKYNRELVDFWQYVSTLLPGRSPLDCKCFWTDYKEGNYKLYNKAIIIARQKDKLRNSSRHHLLSKRSRSGAMSYNSLKMIQYGNMTRENIISEGSGDAITLAVFKDSIHGVRVAVGSLCDENTQYNMPGNLRLWDSDTNNCLSLRGHKSVMESGQEIWRTVTDVKMSKDESLIYSASHDGSANIWKAGTGRLVSTLQFHCKPINQLAVNYSTNENVLASCSNDGTATIWSIGRNGKTGSGVICELDTNFYSDPRVDCISFGHDATQNDLFLGINNKDLEHPGYIEVFDTVSGLPRIKFDSMMGCVSTLAISSSGGLIVSGNYNRFDNLSGDGYIHLHDYRKKDVVNKFYSGHPDVNVVAISPCERYVASGNADKERSEVVIFDRRNHKRILHTLSHDQTLVNQSLIAPDSSIGIGGLYWMSDSRTVLTGGGDSTVKVWNIEGPTRLVKSYQTTNCVTSLTVHEDSMTIAAGVAGAQGIVHVWQP